MNIIKYFHLLIFFSLSGYLNYFPAYNPSLDITTSAANIATNGMVSYTTSAGTQDARFTLLGDGYFSTLSNFSHQFPQDPAGYQTKTFFNQPYKKHIPTIRTKNTGATGNGSTLNNKISMPANTNTRVSTSWSPCDGIENYFLLIFENTSTSVDSGCIEFYYHDAQLSLNSAGILEYGWVQNRTNNSVSTPAKFNQKLKWNFNSLMPGEQRVVYIPMTSRVSEGTKLNIGSKYISGCSGGTGEIVETSVVSSGHPHDPNIKMADKTCIRPFYPDPQTITYTVKFQNEGTAPANNVYLTDYIDINYLDISTLQFVDSEYEYTYNISGNLLVKLLSAHQREPVSFHFLGQPGVE